ncbi:MAG: nucleotide sugar dehydrogenase [Candidatus Methanomethylicia archaeon]
MHNLFFLDPSKAEEKLKSGLLNVTIYGMGHVGLPLAIAWLHAGATVIGVDKSVKVVETINNGLNPIMEEPILNEDIKKYVSEGKFKATIDGVNASRKSELKIVATPTLISEDKRVDLSILEDVLKTTGKGLEKGDIVIIECTVPPGVTSGFARNILEEVSNLKCGVDFGLAYSPERIYEGRALKDIEENYPKIVGGIDSKTTEIVASLYSCIARKGVIKMENSTAAELVKIFEGVYRDVNIALANELAKVCELYNVDYLKVREAANSQPYCHLHLPGCGVGGWCIPVYPYFLVESVKKYGLNLELTALSRKINEEMPKYTVNKLLKLIGNVENKRVAVLGLAFRGDIADTRLSPAYEIIKILNKLGAEIVVYDPYVNDDERLKSMKILQVNNLKEAIENADAVIIATDHSEFKKINMKNLINTGKPLIIIDGRNILNSENIPSNIKYVGIGR